MNGPMPDTSLNRKTTIRIGQIDGNPAGAGNALHRSSTPAWHATLTLIAIEGNRPLSRSRRSPAAMIAPMTITIPDGQPNHRFMRYVRSPVKETERHPPLFSLRPTTRPLRLGIDTTTVPTPPEGNLNRFFGRDEIDIQLLVPVGEEIPTAWMAALHEPLVRQVGFTSIEKAGRELDTRYFWIRTETERETSKARAHFFDVYQHLDAQTAPAGDPIGWNSDTTPPPSRRCCCARD